MDGEGTLVIFSEEILGLGILSLTLAKATTGKTKVSAISPAITGGNTYAYKIGATAVDVAYDAACTAGWTALVVNTTEIAATAGQIITVVEIDASSKAKSVGTATVIDHIG